MSTLRVNNLTAVGGTGTITVPTGNQVVQTGAILQVVSTTKTDVFTTTSTSFTDLTGMTVSVTPKFSTSKIFIMGSMLGDTSAAEAINIRILRDSTVIGAGDAAGNRIQCTTVASTFETNRPMSSSFMFLDSPNTTSLIVYKLQVRTQSGTGFINRCQSDTDITNHPRGVSTITVMEVAG